MPLPAPTYTFQSKQRVVDNGSQENFFARVIESDYAGDNGFIGEVREHGSSISWAAPLFMVEHDDTDIEKNSRKVASVVLLSYSCRIGI